MYIFFNNSIHLDYVTFDIILQDYFVLIPSAYYEAAILSKKVVKPCVIGDKGLCRHFAHPDLKFDSVKAKTGNIVEGGVRSEIYQFVPGSEHVSTIEQLIYMI